MAWILISDLEVSKIFEYTPQCVIFDLLDIDLVHGWILEQQNNEEYDLLSSLSYNQLLDKLIAVSLLKSSEEKTPSQPNSESVSTIHATSPSSEILKPTTPTKPSELQNVIRTSPSPERKDHREILNDKRASMRTELTNISKQEENKILMEGLVIEDFLRKTASQLSIYGLQQLNVNLKENQLCAFFRNNHFSTLFKYKDQVYALITDAGYADLPIVWEELTQVDNNTSFCKADFSLFTEDSLLPPNLSSAVKAVSSSLATLFLNPSHVKDNSETSLQPKHEQIVTAYQPSESDIEQQLVIEKQIAEERKRVTEEKDLEFAMQLHQQELQISQELELFEKLEEPPARTESKAIKTQNKPIQGSSQKRSTPVQKKQENTQKEKRNSCCLQ